MGPLGQSLDGGFLPPVPPNASQEVQISMINDVITRLNNMLKTQTYSDGSNRRMLFGYQKDGWGTGKDFGIKISQPNIDVFKATDEELLFKMDMATWRFFDDTGRNFVNIGMRSSGSYGFEMAKPSEALSDPL